MVSEDHLGMSQESLQQSELWCQDLNDLLKSPFILDPDQSCCLAYMLIIINNNNNNKDL